MRGLSVVERNANDGVSMLQTAEGTLNTVHSMLSRMRELALQSANGTYGAAERGYMNDEFARLAEELDRIASTTEFNGKTLLDGSFSAGLAFQVGLNSVADDRIIVSIPSAWTSTMGSYGGNFLDDQDVATVTAALAALGSIDVAINDTSRIRGNLGAAQNRLEHTIDNIRIMRTNITAANSRIRDADVAAEASALARSSVLTQASTAMLAQANQLPQIALQLLQ
jgi:flagellin